MVYLRASSSEHALLKSPFLCDHTHAHDLGHHYKTDESLIFSYILDPLLSCRHTFSSLSQILQVQNEIILQKMCLNLFSSGIFSSVQLHCLYKITQFRNQAKPYSWFLMSLCHPLQSLPNTYPISQQLFFQILPLTVSQKFTFLSSPIPISLV